MTPTNEAGHGLPELPRAIGLICGRRLTPEGTREFFGFFYEDREMGLKEQVYTAAQVQQYAIDYAAALALSRGVPADMVLVPKVPTDAMLDAGDSAWPKIKNACCPSPESEGVYAAMLAAAPAAAGTQGEEWRCFYCSEVFTDRESAALHFGSGNIFDHKAAGCQIDLAAYRAMEELVSRYQEEDAPVHRQMHRMAGEHAAALRREEERGYARGLRDSGMCPCSATPQPAAADGGVRERAREILTAEYDKAHANGEHDPGRDDIALRAIEAALSSHRQAGDELSKFRELAERWRGEARDMIEIHGSDQTFVCVADALEKMADELMALVEKGAGNG